MPRSLQGAAAKGRASMFYGVQAQKPFFSIALRMRTHAKAPVPEKSFRTRTPAASIPENQEAAQPPTKATRQRQSQSLQGALALLAALLPSSGPGPGRDSCLHSWQLHPSRAAWPSQSLAVKGDEIQRRLHCSDSSTRQPLIVARVVVCCKDASSRRTFQFSACTVDFVRVRAPAQRNF